MMVLTVFLGALLSISLADAAIQNAMRRRFRLPKFDVPKYSIMSREAIVSPNSVVYYFNQLIDHTDPSLGTFQQRYWMNWEFYQTGGPVVLAAPWEVNAEEYNADFLTNKTMTGMIAQQQHGAIVLLEHRFFGFSNPYPNLTSHSLELLTIQQAIDDIVYFVQNVDLPMPSSDNVTPSTTQWVLLGASYAGALTGWTMVNKPGIFRAGYASSAVVEVITDFYAFFTPIREYMPQNCSSDVQAVIAYLDQINSEKNTTAIQNLKDAFGLGGLSHIDDFAAALMSNMFDWETQEPVTGPGSLFYQFCDALEVKDGVNAPPTGWGLEHAIDAWGSFWKDTYYPNVCGSVNAETCLGSHNASESYWTNVTVNNSNRSWFWLMCTQVGFYQSGPPLGQPAIVSRILQPIYGERQCVNMFPEKFSSPPSPAVSDVNDIYQGWNLNVDRLFFSSGLRDPWRGATVSADGLNKANTTMQPIYESDGFHASDLLAENGNVDSTVYAVQRAGLACMKEWLA